ncbi:hypothetical protein ACXYUI_27200, partial [Klebsiella pneumoniae]
MFATLQALPPAVREARFTQIGALTFGGYFALLGSFVGRSSAVASHGLTRQNLLDMQANIAIADQKYRNLADWWQQSGRDP